MGRRRVTSPQNPLVKSWVKLMRDGRARREAGAFVLEGKRLVRTALELGRVRSLAYSRKLAGDDPLVGEARRSGVDVVELSAAAFRKIAGVPSPQGVAAIAEIRETGSESIFRPDALVLVACGVAEPGNLGAMMRSAFAAGATGFLALPPSADLYHPRAVRASAGAILALPCVRVSEEELIAGSQRTGMRLLAAMPRGGTDLLEADYSRPVAIAVGSEAHGLPEALAGRAAAVTIPMQAGAESLNAAAAAAVILFEAARGRP